MIPATRRPLREDDRAALEHTAIRLRQLEASADALVRDLKNVRIRLKGTKGNLRGRRRGALVDAGDLDLFDVSDVLTYAVARARDIDLDRDILRPEGDIYLTVVTRAFNTIPAVTHILSLSRARRRSQKLTNDLTRERDFICLLSAANPEALVPPPGPPPALGRPAVRSAEALRAAGYSTVVP